MDESLANHLCECKLHSVASLLGTPKTKATALQKIHFHGGYNVNFCRNCFKKVLIYAHQYKIFTFQYYVI